MSLFRHCHRFDLISTQLRADVTLPTLAQVQAAGPGATTYEIVFATSDGTTATDSNPSDYNEFVTQEANQDGVLANLGTSWYAIIETGYQNLDDGVAQPNVPIFSKLGQLVATGENQLFPGDNLNSPLDGTQYGTTLYTAVWTGDVNGDPDPLGPSWIGGGGDVGYGYDESNFTLEFQLDYAPPAEIHSYYALSSPISVPEPSTLALLSAGAVGLLAYAWRRCAP